jgi:hypothetical protein
MRLIEVTARAGYVWFRQGIWLFRRSPLAFLAMFFAYIFATMLLSQIPLLGDVLPLLLVPGIAVGFMSACRDAVAGKPVTPVALAAGFRASGKLAAQRLLVLGVCYVLAIPAAFAVSALVDGGALFGTMVLGAPLGAEAMTSIRFPLAMMAACLAYVPVSMLFWFAPVLSAWHDVPPHKALFFSWVACWRNRGAFAVYGLLWAALFLGVSIAVTLLLRALGSGMAAVVVLTPLSVVIVAAMYCSFYATYQGCFDTGDGAPGQMPESPGNPPG